jgi:hypothetical protein
MDSVIAFKQSLSYSTPASYLVSPSPLSVLFSELHMKNLRGLLQSHHSSPPSPTNLGEVPTPTGPAFIALLNLAATHLFINPLLTLHL